jgi:serine/threonine protein kinase
MTEISRKDDASAGAQEPILLKNRIAVLTPDPIAEGSFGQVYVGKILNPVGLLAERVAWGEESPRWLGLDDIPFDDPDKEGGKLPTPVTDPIHRKRIDQAAERLWTDYLDRRNQDRARADEEYRDLLNLIDPMLHEDRIIAVKVLRPPVDRDPADEQKIVADSIRRFIKENDILRTLRHPGIVRRFGLINDPKMGWCILLEYIEGETLDVYLRKQPDGRLPLARAAWMSREIVDALRYIHGKNVVHRDLKPQNIMIRRDDERAVIMDFGIGKWVDEYSTQQFTQSGMRVGTPRYMAPEQARIDGVVTQAADVYQLSTILFEMVTGHMAYENKDHNEIFKWLLDLSRRHPTYVHDFLPQVSPEFEALIEVGRDKAPEKRWTIEEFKSKLEHLLEGGRYEGKPARGPEDRTELLQALEETRIQIKEAHWREHLLQKRLDMASLRARIHEAWSHLERRAYIEVQGEVESLAREALQLPEPARELRAEIENLERAWKLAKGRHEAEYLLAMAEQHFTAQRFTDTGAALDAASQRLLGLPRDSYGDVHERYAALSGRFEAQHRSFVDLFNTLRKSFVDKIQDRYKELHDQYGSGKPLETAKIIELLQQTATAENNLGTIDREKVGPGTYDATKKHLWELRVALEDLHKRVTAGV